MFIAQMPVGPSKQLKQIIQTKYNIVKNSNWPETNQLAIYKRCRGLNSGLLRNKSMQWSERDPNPGPLDCESDKLATRSRCLPTQITAQ